MAFLDRHRFPVGDLSKARPWYAAIRLRDYALERAGFRKSLGLEQVYFNKARMTSKPVGGLSTFEDQVARSAAIDDMRQMTALMNLIDHLADIGAEAGAVVEAWKQGTLSHLDRGTLASDDIAMSNALWAPRILRLVQNSSSPTMIMIGMAHFSGSKGIQQLLS